MTLRIDEMTTTRDLAARLYGVRCSDDYGLYRVAPADRQTGVRWPVASVRGSTHDGDRRPQHARPEIPHTDARPRRPPPLHDARPMHDVPYTVRGSSEATARHVIFAASDSTYEAPKGKRCAAAHAPPHHHRLETHALDRVLLLHVAQLVLRFIRRSAEHSPQPIRAARRRLARHRQNVDADN